ncbi:MAG: hypothetical protein IJ867_03770 [Clostridia bacterium]|nr:hypothetical protein [Clostridia bacterium]
MKYIGKLDVNKLGKYKDKIVTEDVIITNERIEHIKEHHPELKNRELKFIKKLLKNPDYIFEDRKNKDTILMVKEYRYYNKLFRMVVKLNTNIEAIDKFNSIISFWHISKKKLEQYKRNEKIIFKMIDNTE